MSEPVVLICLPDNGRLDFNPDESEEILGKFATLPIPMPRGAMAWTGRDGKPLALWCDDMRIRPSDFATVLAGIEQFNDDCRDHGERYSAMPFEVLEDGDEAVAGA